MSTVFIAWCDTCEERGPTIRRHHSGALLMQKDSPRFFPVSDAEVAKQDWGAFLIEHKYHELRLYTESVPADFKPPERRKPTHELGQDGELLEIRGQ